MRAPVIGVGQQEQGQSGAGSDDRDGPHPRADPI